MTLCKLIKWQHWATTMTMTNAMCVGKDNSFWEWKWRKNSLHLFVWKWRWKVCEYIYIMQSQHCLLGHLVDHFRAKIGIECELLTGKYFISSKIYLLIISEMRHPCPFQQSHKSLSRFHTHRERKRHTDRSTMLCCFATKDGRNREENFLKHLLLLQIAMLFSKRHPTCFTGEK